MAQVKFVFETTLTDENVKRLKRLIDFKGSRNTSVDVMNDIVFVTGRAGEENFHAAIRAVKDALLNEKIKFDFIG